MLGHDLTAVTQKDPVVVVRGDLAVVVRRDPATMCGDEICCRGRKVETGDRAKKEERE